MNTKKLSEAEMAPLKIAALPTRPTAPTAYGGKGYSSIQMKEAFDKLPELIAARTLEKEATYRECCLEDPEHFHLIAGAERFLDFLKAEGVDFTIATGSEYSNVDFYFEKFGLGKWFDRSRVVLDDGTFPGKPAPDGYLRAAKVLGRDPADCVVFEDSISGVRASHAAGVGQTVAITTEVSAERLLSYPGVVIAEPDFDRMIEIWKETLSK